MELLVSDHEVFASTGGRLFDPQKPVVVFVHGAGFDHTTWTLQARSFAHRDFSVLAVDLPGHGRSAGEPLQSIDQLGDWLVALLHSCGVERAALVGHSMGALASLAAAARHPERVTRLALLGVSETMAVHPDLLDAAERNDHLAFELVAGWSLGPAARRHGHESPRNWLYGSCVRTLERTRPGVLHTDLAACDRFGDAAPLAFAIQCPTLFVLGSADKMTPVRAAGPLVGLVGNAVVELIPDAGHMMMMERSRIVNAVLGDFLAADQSEGGR